MSKNTNSSIGWGTIVAVVGFIASLIAIFTFITGIQFIKEIRFDRTTPTRSPTKPVIEGTPVIREEQTFRFLEDFSTSQLRSEWNWVDPLGDSKYSINSGLGSLQVTVPGNSHDFWGDQGYNAPRLMLVANGSFIATTSVTLNPETFYQGAGILIFKGDNEDWIRLEVGNVNGQRDAFVFHQDGSVKMTSNPSKIGSPTSYLMIKRCGNSITGLVSADNISWQEITTIPYPDETPVSVGLIASSNRKSDSLVVNYDFFKLSPCP